MRSLYPAASVISLFLVGSAAAQEGSRWSDWLFGGSDSMSQQGQFAEAKPKPPTGQAAPPAQPPAETAPATRTETTNFDNWILSCRELVDGPKKRSCAMTVAVRKSDTNRTVLSWTIRPNESGQLVSVIETLPGISIAPGIQLKLEMSAAARKVPIEICEPNWCSGTLAMDKSFIQETVASSKVSVIVTSSNGQPFTFEFPIKGFDKAYAKM